MAKFFTHFYVSRRLLAKGLLEKRTSCKLSLMTGVFLSICGATSSAYAAAFYLQEHSVSGLGAAYAGTASTAEDASTIYYNPAGMTQLKKGEVSLEAVGLIGQASVKDGGSTIFGAPTGGPQGDNSLITSVIPSGFVAYPIYEDRIWAGLGITTPFGLSNDYKDNWFGRFDSIKSDLRTYDVQPTLAVKVNNWLSLGGGPDFQHGTAELTSAINNGITTGTSKLDGDDNAWGYTLGATLTPLPGTRIGFDYRSEINYNLDGRVVITGVPGSPFVPPTQLNRDSAAHAKLDLPAQATIGFSQDINKQWTAMAQATWFEWSNFHDITPILDDTGTAFGATQEEYKNTLNFSVGAEYKWTKQWTFRGGYEFDDSPTNNQYRDTRIPDANRNWFTAGATYAFNSQLSVDLAAAYIRLNDSSIDVTRNGGAATIIADKKGGQIGLLGLGLNYKF